MDDVAEPVPGGEGLWVPCPREVPVCLTTSGVLDSIGNTPLLQMQAATSATGCRVYAKAEYLNPGGSIKDRIARAIIEGAERRGDLRPGSTILEVTSGNTGIGLAMIGALKGYRVVILMPRTVSRERRDMIASFGAELHLLDEIRSIQGAVERTLEIDRGDPDVFLPGQFANPDNPLCHERTTGPEIIHQTGGRLDAFVMGIGTGGTLMGVGRAIRRAGLEVRVVAVEPDESARRLGPGHTVVTVLPDRGERYLSGGAGGA